jgi:hypothetical protein
LGLGRQDACRFIDSCRALQDRGTVAAHRLDHELQALQRAPRFVGRATTRFQLFDRAARRQGPGLRRFQMTLCALEIETLPLKVRHCLLPSPRTGLAAIRMPAILA